MDLKKQNILFFTRTMNLGGTENVILQLCEILKPRVNKIVVCSCGGVNVKILKEMGIKHYKIPDIQDKSPKKIIQTIRIVKHILKKEKITVVHSHHRMAAFYTELLCGSSILKIANAHNTFYDKKFLTRFAYRNTKLIAVGEQVKKNLTNYFCLPDEQVTVIHNAIKAFDGNIALIPEISEAKENDCVVIGNVGRLSEQKGMEYFIQAARKVLDVRENVRFFIIGDGEDREKISAMVDEFFPNGELKMLGYRSDVQNVMSQLDFIVLSSLWEGLPLTPIEAFSVNRTIIATAVDGTPEIVKNKKNGLLVHKKNVNELSSAMIKLIDNQNFIRKLEKNAQKDYENRFSFDILSDSYINYYNNLNNGNMKKITAFIFDLSKGGAQGVFVSVVNYLHDIGYNIEVVVQNNINPIYSKYLRSDISVVDLKVKSAKMMLPKLLKYIKNNDFDIALAFNPEIALNLYFAKKFLLKDFRLIGRCINTLSIESKHTTVFFRKYVTFPILKLFYHNIDIVISQSRGMADDLIENFGFNKNQLKIINNPLSEKYEKELFNMQHTSKENYILYAGRLEEQKGLHMLLEAFSNINDKKVKLKLIGSGSLKNELYLLSKKIGIDKRVEFIEHTLQLEDYYKSARLTVLSSYFEGFPNVLVESMACGTPCVSFDLPSGPSEIIIDGENGYLVEYLNVIELAEKIDMALNKSWDYYNVKKSVERFKHDVIMPSYKIVIEED